MAPIQVEKDAQSRAKSADPHQPDVPEIPAELPILSLRDTVIFPYTINPFTISQERSLRLINEVSVAERLVGAVAYRDPSLEEPTSEQVYTTGTLCAIHRLMKAPDGQIHLFLQGLTRIRIEAFTATEPYFKARVAVFGELLPPLDDVEVQALRRSLGELFARMARLMGQIPDEVVNMVQETDDLRLVVYLIAHGLRTDVPQAQEILELERVKEQMQRLVGMLTREVEVLEMGRKIQSEARSEMDKSQREYFLRQQLDAIKRELGEGDEQQVQIETYKQKIAAAGLSDEAAKEARRELDRLEKLPPGSAEYGVIQTYLDWLTDLPWEVATEDNLDIGLARQLLDEDHYGLDKVKERLLEFLAVRKLRLERQQELGLDREEEDSRAQEGVILCFVGPPGVGKTSLGQSIARAMGRKFIRMSLGGVRDEAEIRGHRRTYIGALPGRIIQALRRAGSNNPVLMLDEIDKVGADWRGDPSSALLEVLDPAQNSTFRDHYLDVNFDLSQVLFIATANVVDTIAPPLLDRMEPIELSGYTEEEKSHIGQRYLVARQLRSNGLRPSEVSFTDAAMRTIVQEHTHEAGVRSLERQIGTICRKAAAQIAAGEADGVVVDEDAVSRFLGKARFFRESRERTDQAGVATGLAVTAVGGDILFVEATLVPDDKGLTLTGQLGKVMQESAQAAVSYVRTQADALGCDAGLFKEHAIHLHVPAGAVPKDGPSAGVTIAVALASLLTGRRVRDEVGMTGEITLRGKVLAVGGIKEKVLAAHRAGLSTVILPRRNEKDLDELPENVRHELAFTLVDTVDEVFAQALEPTAS